MEVVLAVKEFLAAKCQLSPHTRCTYTQRLSAFAVWCEQQGYIFAPLEKWDR